MSKPSTVIRLTRDTLPVYLSIFGDPSAGDADLRQRANVRYPSERPVEIVRMLSPYDADMCTARCVDISEDGIGFVCRDELTLGEEIQIYLSGETETYTLAGKIIHASPTESGFRIGAQFVWT
jgi:hypothetical protein